MGRFARFRGKDNSKKSGKITEQNHKGNERMNTALVALRTLLIAALALALGFFIGREHLRLENPNEPKIIFQKGQDIIRIYLVPKMPVSPPKNLEDLEPNIEAEEHVRPSLLKGEAIDRLNGGVIDDMIMPGFFERG